jgi:hypothetical protein
MEAIVSVIRNDRQSSQLAARPEADAHIAEAFRELQLLRRIQQPDVLHTDQAELVLQNTR